MKTPKYPDDFKDWKRVGIMQSPLRRGRYLILDSPDGRHQACIHLEDNHVVGVMDMVTGGHVYGDDLARALRLARVLKKRDRVGTAIYRR